MFALLLKVQVDQQDGSLRILFFLWSLLPSRPSVSMQHNSKMGPISQDYSPSSVCAGEYMVGTSETKSAQILESTCNGGGELRHRKYTKISKN